MNSKRSKKLPLERSRAMCGEVSVLRWGRGFLCRWGCAGGEWVVNEEDKGLEGWVSPPSHPGKHLSLLHQHGRMRAFTETRCRTANDIFGHANGTCVCSKAAAHVCGFATAIGHPETVQRPGSSVSSVCCKDFSIVFIVYPA